MNRYFKLIAILMIAASGGNDNSSAKKTKVKEAHISSEDQSLWADRADNYKISVFMENTQFKHIPQNKRKAANRLFEQNY